MQQGKQWSETSRHVAVAVIYAIGFMALRQVSFSHWVLFAGFRLSALLLVPYRYWPALFVGELGPEAYTSFSCLDSYGLAWSMVAAVPPIGLAMPVVRLGRERLRMFPDRVSVDMGAFLSCAFVASIVWSLFNLLVLSLAVLPPGSAPLHYVDIEARWFVGNFLGVLTVAPLVLYFRELRNSGKRPVRLGDLVRSPLLVDTLIVLLPALGLLVWLGIAASTEGVRQSARMAMFLPVVWLALRHGWHGASVGGTLASIAVVLTMPAIADAGTLQAQVFIAFAVTTMLLLGARIATLASSGKKEREDTQVALVLAQRNMLLGELQLRQTSDAVEHIREAVQGTYGQLLQRIQHFLPVNDERDYRQRVAVTQQQLFRLADSLHPVAWRAEGLTAALRQGAIARALGDCGVAYWCDIRESGTNRLSQNMTVAIYRMVCDAIVHLCAGRAVSSVTVRLKIGREARGSVPVAVIIKAAGGEGASTVSHDALAMTLSSSGLGIEAVRDRAAIFAGSMKVRETADRGVVSLLLHDAQP